MTHLLAFLLGAAAVLILNNRSLNRSYAQLVSTVADDALQWVNTRLEFQDFWKEQRLIHHKLIQDAMAREGTLQRELDASRLREEALRKRVKELVQLESYLVE